jgi:hypothetical protein
MSEPKRFSFNQMMEENPCEGCPAPCCRMHLSEYGVPNSFQSLDYVRYSLMFPGTEFLVSSDGGWSMLRWQTCAALRTDTCTCSLQGTAAKPRVCTTFSPFGCWYKRNFTTEEPPDLYRLDLARFEVWSKEIVFDENGFIVGVPSFERARALLKDIPVQPALRMDPRFHKPGPADGAPCAGLRTPDVGDPGMAPAPHGNREAS